MCPAIKSALVLQEAGVEFDWSGKPSADIEALATLVAGFKWQRDELAALVSIKMYQNFRENSSRTRILEIVEDSWNSLQEQKEEIS